MIKNFYYNPIYFFGWQQTGKDMEAENYFLADTEKDNVKNTIKVYPCMDTRNNLPRTFRDAAPAELGKTSMSTGWFSSLQFIGAMYFRMQERLNEGDNLSLFGILNYDTRTG